MGWIWDAEHGLTASKKVVSRTHVLAAGAVAVPYLLSAEQLVALTGEVLTLDGHAVRLPGSTWHHPAHRQRYAHLEGGLPQRAGMLSSRA